jgi:hypothetical protein
MEDVCMELGLSFSPMDNMNNVVVNDEVVLRELVNILQRSMRRYGSPLRNEATTTRHVEEVLTYFMDPYLDDINLKLQEPVNGTAAHGVVDGAISSRRNGVQALAAAFEAKSGTTMAEGIPQCISQLHAMHEHNMQCGYSASSRT